MKRLVEEAASSTDTSMDKSLSSVSGILGDSPYKNMTRDHLELRLHHFEEALHCPIQKDLWKEMIVTRCGHMFSKKALDDTVTGRNRKCPTCKVSTLF